VRHDLGDQFAAMWQRFRPEACEREYRFAATRFQERDDVPQTHAAEYTEFQQFSGRDRAAGRESDGF
jgi:hypothetical protein